MKIKPIIISVTAACYAMGIAASVPSNVLGETKPKAIDMMQLYKIQKEAANANSDKKEFLSPLRNDALSNVHFTPKSISDKIKLEKNLTGTHTYIVRLLDEPIATYQGTIPGLQATKASAKSIKLFNASKAVGAPQEAVDAYQTHLLAKQDSFVQAAVKKGVTLDVRRHFTTAINAVTVELTQSQVLKLAEMPEVAYVQRSKQYELHTDVGPEHIGAGGVWDGSGTTEVGSHKGEGMLVGMIDTGINTQHPSFAAIDGDGYEHVNPLGSGNYLGDCVKEEYTDRCNDKLIGVYTHPTVTDTFFSIPPDDWTPAERLMPEFGEDWNGHGSHTSSTVAGNTLYDVNDLLPEYGGGHGIPIGVKMPKASGVAPRANIISYQVCMPTGGCGGEAMLFAIDQAIQDGVDVINMSIGGGESFPWDDAFEMAFLSAREAGVAVALSAGNSGAAYGTDSLYTVDHTSPWVLNVAATTHARSIEVSGKALNNFTGGDTNLTPLQFDGAGISGSFTGEFVVAADFGDARCNSPFAPGTFSSSQIVVCERGDIARFQKAINVQAGGGGAFVLYNTSAEGDQVNDDPYAIPGIHITRDQWEGPSWKIKALKPWLASGTALTGTITASEVSREIIPDDADWLATFSSRGPSSTVDELFSPGIAAPGVDIFAAWTEENPFEEFSDTRDWNRISGTSMASPHVAGAMTLIRQAHPEWTASEVQSALQMSADSKAIKMEHPVYNEVVVAGPYRAGHGLVNVARAIDSGLIMDETAENFRRANPQNGGRVRDLNLPQLINRDCGRQCSWTRTVKATQDGTWSVNVEKLQQDHMSYDWTLDPTAVMNIAPSTFSLKAGESITLTVTSNFNEVDMAWYDGTVHADQGEIQFIAENSNTPIAIWPYSSLYTGKTLPNTVNVVATDDNATATVTNVPFGVPSSAINAVGYAPVELTTSELTIPRMGFGVSIFTEAGYFNIVDNEEMGIVAHEFIQAIPVTVPENSAIFRAELGAIVATTSDNELGTDSYINADIYIAKDFNGDGMLHYTEAVCGSFLAQTTEGEFCSMENPEAGDYTILVTNGVLYPWEAIDTIALSYGVVSKDVSSGISFEFTPSADDELTSDMSITWDESLPEGSIWHSAIAIQAGDNAEGSLTLVPMQIQRGANTVSVSASQTNALVGDIVDMSVVVQANKSGDDRMVELTAVLSDGLTIVPGSMNSVEGLTMTENGFTINASQENSADWATNYQISTSDTDEMCRNPWDEYLPENNGGYVNLSNYGIAPSWGSFFEVNEWGWGNWVHELQIPFLTDTSNSISPFDNETYFKTNQMVLSSRGWIQLDIGNYNPWDIVPQQIHLELPSTGYSTPPDYLFAPLWNAGQDINWNQYMTLAKLSGNSGVSLAYLGDYVLVEWDNAQTHDKSFDINWNTTFEPRDDSYNHEMFMRGDTSYAPGEYEVVMAYDGINFGSQSGSGSIGLRGYNGPRAGFWPLNGHTGVSLAYNNLDEVVKDGLMVCYDVVGPESTRITVNFKVEVTSSAIASAQTLDISGTVEGVSTASDLASIEVASNLGLVGIDDQTIEENTILEGLSVNYTDSDGGVSANTISVMGENISATISGHTSGSTFDITPDANFHGDTLVTVTVTDNVFVNDRSSVSFMLSVNSDGIEFGCTDSSATNYDSTANENDGSCTYPQTVEPAAETSSGSGSMGIYLLLIALISGVRTRKIKN